MSRIKYTRLDDDTSFGILRINPKLSTNVKVMYDGTNIFLESYSATPLLSTDNYKHCQVKSKNLYNSDMKSFATGVGNGIFEVGQNMSDLIMGDTFDNQFETMYWTGVETINSAFYPQELGFISPLYLRKKRPDFFVVFKVEGLANTNLNYSGRSQDKFIDDTFDFSEDILSKARIIKTFDLREGTPIGDYIKTYVSQKDFKYDQSVYVNFSSHEIYYYGIDISTGVLTQKVENMSDQLIDRDTTILRMDDWITDGFRRNDLIFPYILNLEFMFDDNEPSNEFKFARYFGMYCNAIDLQNIRVNDIENDRVIFHKNEKVNETLNSSSFYYIKGKDNLLYTFEKKNNDYVIKCNDRLDENNFIGFESSTISSFCEKVSGLGCAEMEIQITDKLVDGDRIHLYNDLFKVNMSEDYSAEIDYWHIAEFCATSKLSAGEYSGTEFSCKGKINDIASALTKCISAYEDHKWVNAYCSGNRVVLRAVNSGAHLNGKLRVYFKESMNSRVKKVMPEFQGGTDSEGTLFKVYTKDINMYIPFDDTECRYIKYGDGSINAKIESVIPYINENDEIDSTYSLLTTDANGEFVTISSVNQIEILDYYYAKIGVLSFFPVRDFDFDTIKSAYSDGTTFSRELRVLDIELMEGDSKAVTIPYGRFFDDEGEELENEYAYYKENVLPELAVTNKTVPFVSKWGYTDESKDSCENPYRLNTSKIFNTCNFSANTFVQRGDILEYTHSMPYYITRNEVNDINEYQYIHYDLPVEAEKIKASIAFWKNLFSRNDEDNFEKIFGNTGGNKRFNRKYSRFLNGDTVHHPSTLFRGVKFDIIELQGNKEVKSAKYNNYRFSFIYIPVNTGNLYFSNRVYFIKNETFHFVVGMVFVNTLKDYAGISSIVEKENKALMYGGCFGIIPTSNYKINTSSLSTIPIGDLFSYKTLGRTYLDEKYIDTQSIKIKMPTVLTAIKNINKKTGRDIEVSSLTFRGLTDTDKIEINCSRYNVVITPDGVVKNIKSDTHIDTDKYLYVDLSFRSENIPYCDGLYDAFVQLSVNDIKKNINDCLAVEYSDADNDVNYKIKVIDPDGIDVYDIFTSVPVVVMSNNKNIIGSSDISIKSDASKLHLLTLNRYSGYYNPIFKDILFYNDYDVESNYSNTAFAYDYKDNSGSFGIINNMWFHKVNDTKKNIFKSLETYYPLINQYALDHKDYNIWSSSADKNYYTKQLDLNHSAKCANICSMKNNLCMFGGRYLDVPDSIEIEVFSGCEEWNDDWITNPDACESEIMYKEVNDNSVDFYFFLHKRILRYFCENREILDEFRKYINDEYSYKLDGIEDDIKEYISKNIIGLYKLDKIRVFIKGQKIGKHNSRIENEYSLEDNIKMTVSELKAKGFSEVTTVSMSKINVDDFDRKLVYNLRNGTKEDFGFSFSIKRI